MTGRQTYHVDYQSRSPAERDFPKAKRVPKRRISQRLAQDGERRYTAYSLDELLAIESEANFGRPGLPHA